MMKAKYVLREVMKYLKDNKDSDVLIKDNKDLLQYIQVLKKLPDVKERDNPYIYKPKSELNFATPRDWNKEEVNDE